MQSIREPQPLPDKERSPWGAALVEWAKQTTLWVAGWRVASLLFNKFSGASWGEAAKAALDLKSVGGDIAIFAPISAIFDAPRAYKEAVDDNRRLAKAKLAESMAARSEATMLDESETKPTKNHAADVLERRDQPDQEPQRS